MEDLIVPGKIVHIFGSDIRNSAKVLLDHCKLYPPDSIGRRRGFIVMSKSGNVYLVSEAPVTWPVADSVTHLLVGEYHVIGMERSSEANAFHYLVGKYLQIPRALFSAKHHRVILAYDVENASASLCLLNSSYNAEYARRSLNYQYGILDSQADPITLEAQLKGKPSPYDFEVTPEAENGKDSTGSNTARSC